MSGFTLIAKNLKFWTALLFSCLVTIWFLPWRFQTNDDVMMMWLVSGAYTGTPEPYAIFIHPLLSGFFSVLYRILPGFNWYGLVWFSVIGFSGFLLLKVIFTQFKNSWELTFWLIFVLILSIHLSFFPQFTLVAGIGAFSGLTVMFNDRFEYRKYKIGGWICLILAMLIRLESVVLVSLGWMWQTIIFSGFRQKSQISRLLLVFFIGLALLLSKNAAEEKWLGREFLEFNKARAWVRDHPVLNSLHLEDALVAGTDKYFFYRWMFEELPLDVEELKDQKNELDRQLFSGKELVNGFYRVIQVQKTELFKSMLILTLCIGFFQLNLPMSKKLLFFIGWLVFFLVFNHFNLLFGRVNFLFFLILFFPILFHGFLQLKSPRYSQFSFVLLLFFVFHLLNFSKEANGRVLINKELNVLIRQKPLANPIFLEGFLESNILGHFTWKNPVPILSYGWISKSPFQRKAYELRNLTRQSELTSYSLISFQFPEPLVFPTYMNKISGPYFQKREEKTLHLVRIDFVK